MTRLAALLAAVVTASSAAAQTLGLPGGGTLARDACAELVARAARKEPLTPAEALALTLCFATPQPGGGYNTLPSIGDGFMTYQPPPDLFDYRNIAPWADRLEFDS